MTSSYVTTLYGLVGASLGEEDAVEETEMLPPAPLYRSGTSMRDSDEYDQAASYICDALDGVIHKQPLSSRTATFAYHVHLHIVLVIKNLLVPALVMISFFERPFWCSGEECECAWDPEDPETCPYPTFDVWYLPDDKRLWVEGIILAVCLAHQLLLRIALGGEGYWVEDGHSFLAITGAIIMNSLIATSWFKSLIGSVVVLPYFRLSVFVAYSEDVKQQLRLAFNILPRYSRIGILIMLLIATFAWACIVLYPNTGGGEFSEGDTYFPNLYDGMWHAFILITTSNNPDVMAPAYAHNRWNCVLFIGYLCIGYFFLMNLLLATVYNVYTEEQEKLEKKMKMARDQNLRSAFNILANDGSVDTVSIRGVFAELNQHREVMYINDERSDLLLEALDHTTDSKIDFGDFAKLCSVLQLEIKRPPTIRGHRGKLRRFVTSHSFEYFVDFLLVINAIVVAIQTSDELRGLPPRVTQFDNVWEFVEAGLALFYVCEMVAKLYALGFKDYFRLKSNTFDFVVTVCSAFTVVIVYYPNAYNDAKFIKLVILTRLLRLFRLLVHLPEYQLIGESFFAMMPAASRLLKLLFCVCYVFALIGMALYGGMINTDPDRPEYAKLVESDYYDSLYAPLNFNDLWSSFVLLFGVLVVNNWWVLADGPIAVAGKSARLYFIAFYCVAVLICANLVTAFVIDAFLAEYERAKKKEDDEDQPKGLAVQHPSLHD